MFTGDVLLVTAPELPAETLADYCYYGMFTGCTGLSYIKCPAVDISASGSTSIWVNNVAASGTFVKNANASNWSIGVNGIPNGWVTIDVGVPKPSIYCDGKYITISCDAPDADIYYELNQSGNYIYYDGSIPITADTTISAYSELESETSTTVSATCVYVAGPNVPVITCDGKRITITCSSAGAAIYYSLDQGAYTLYESAITITADTVVQAYSQINGEISTTVMESCVYDPSYDYSQDYLTFDILTGGTILWKAFGSLTKEISYSLDSGQTWSAITSTSAGVPITVTAGDKLLVKGNNAQYATSKTAYSNFLSGSAFYNLCGNIMSLVAGDSFSAATGFSTTFVFCSLFKQSNVVSAENLVLPAMTLTADCYRAMFSFATFLSKAPKLPATTLATECYWYMFEACPIVTAPELPAATLASKCYGNMFTACTNLNYIKCLATAGINTGNTQGWVSQVASNGTFIKASGVTSWSVGVNGIPTNWVVYEDGQTIIAEPEITCDGEYVTMTCETAGASIYYRLDQTGDYSAYTSPITITADTFVDAYAISGSQSSITVSQNCEYISSIPISAANRTLENWKYNNMNVTTPYSVNAIDGHSANYLRGTFNFETSFCLREVQPTYLWFQHADQSAAVYIDNTLVEKHWGGYNAFFVDVTSHVHSGTNHVKVALKNNEGSYLAPCAGDFNYNATLGYVNLLTSPVLPQTKYGYDGFHVTSNVDLAQSSATINVKTTIPSGGVAWCKISGVSCNYSVSATSDGSEMTFTAGITNPRLWNGTIDPYLYDITLEIYSGNVLYHSFQRGYGLRHYEYVFSASSIPSGGSSYTGFLLNGVPYQLRGVCMHNDIDGKANALTRTDIANDFALIQDLGCNFIRLAHYPHPKEVYDWCDQLGIIVQTEIPWVNNAKATQPTEYYDHSSGQCEDMVNQHYNHPSIMFWGLSNETTTDDKNFAKAKIEAYTALIKNLDSERMVGYVMSHSFSDPSAYYNNPSGIDWFGCNIYVGWYIDKASNDPTSQLESRVDNIINNKHKALAFSEYGCGGTQHCHSDNFTATTTTGNYERHDIEYQMWLHEGHIASIRNFPQLLFTGEWQLFDIAVSNRNEGYTICLDGENTSTDDNLRRLNNKGLVERDHTTKKDTYYIYKAEWNPTPFVHICGKDYTKKTGRSIKCYTNDGSTLSLYVDGTLRDTANVTDHIAVFAADNYTDGNVITVYGDTQNDTFTF